jgi:hypothetical protein
MNMANILLVKDDTSPQIQVTITREDTGVAVNLSAATTRMKFRAAETTTVLATLTGTAGDLAAGVVIFTFGSGDLNQTAGEYEGEIEVTFADSSVETVFEVINFTLRADF